RFLPVIALFLFLAGAGLGVSVATVTDLETLTLRLVGDGGYLPEFGLLVARLHGALDLLTLSLGSGFGLLGVGLWRHQAARHEQHELVTHLSGLIQAAEEGRKRETLRLESLLTTQVEQTRELAAELAVIRETTSRAEELVKNPPTPLHAPPVNALMPLVSFAARADDDTPHAPFHRRLAIAGPELPGDQQDEEFEPF
ncbi:MAG: hypothetical protein HQL97_16655, partial [Magnetococcales bacterium]|nr:hypothetical protein [Magnetococcales bacterium]